MITIIIISTLRSLLEDKKLLTVYKISLVTVLEGAKDKAYTDVSAF